MNSSITVDIMFPNSMFPESGTNCHTIVISARAIIMNKSLRARLISKFMSSRGHQLSVLTNFGCLLAPLDMANMYLKITGNIMFPLMQP